MTFDNLLLLLIAVTVFAKAVLVRRETTFGRSMAAFNLALTVLFVYGAARAEWPQLSNRGIVVGLRLILWFAALWTLSQLAIVARNRWRLARRV